MLEIEDAHPPSDGFDNVESIHTANNNAEHAQSKKNYCFLLLCREFYEINANVYMYSCEKH